MLHVDQSRPMKRGRPKRAPVDLGTDETRARLQQDPLQRLRETGFLSPEHEAACYAIRAAVRALTATVALRVQCFERMDRGHGEWSEELSSLVERYCDWADAMHRRGLSVIKALDALMDDGLSPRGNPMVIRQALDIWVRLRF